MTRSRRSARQAGTRWESAIVAALRAAHWPHAERRAKTGAKEIECRVRTGFMLDWNHANHVSQMRCRTPRQSVRARGESIWAKVLLANLQERLQEFVKAHRDGGYLRIVRRRAGAPSSGNGWFYVSQMRCRAGICRGSYAGCRARPVQAVHGVRREGGRARMLGLGRDAAKEWVRIIPCRGADASRAQVGVRAFHRSNPGWPSDRSSLPEPSMRQPGSPRASHAQGECTPSHAIALRQRPRVYGPEHVLPRWQALLQGMPQEAQSGQVVA